MFKRGIQRESLYVRARNTRVVSFVRDDSEGEFMKRIGVVFFHNLRYAPFIKHYTDLLDRLDDVEYEIKKRLQYPLASEPYHSLR